MWTTQRRPGPYTARFDPDHPAPFENAGFGWATDAEAINIGAGQLRLRPADLLKIGQLYLDNGKWQDQQLVSAGWIAASIGPSAASDSYAVFALVSEVILKTIHQ